MWSNNELACVSGAATVGLQSDLARENAELRKQLDQIKRGHDDDWFDEPVMSDAEPEAARREVDALDGCIKQS